MKPMYWLGYNTFRSMARALFDVEPIGLDNVPMTGPMILASNHESYLDPPLIGTCFHHDVHYLARKTLFKGLGGFLYSRWNAIPVDQEQRDLKGLKTIIRLLKSGQQVVIFPEGARSFDGKLQKAEAGVGMIVAKTKVPVVPVFIEGACEALPRGTKIFKLSPIKVYFGKPINFSASDYKVKSREGYQHIADRIMDSIAHLGT